MIDENIFGYAGLLDKKTHYIPAIGIIDYFWTLRPYSREVVLKGWISSLQKVLENTEFEPNEIQGAMLVFPNEEIVEYKESDNVVQFPNLPKNI